MNQPTEPKFLDDVGLKKPDRSFPFRLSEPANHTYLCFESKNAFFWYYLFIRILIVKIFLDIFKLLTINC
jgi:hypothetical protein